jgi:hypothetical protein
VRRCREQIAAAGLGPQVRIDSSPSDLLSIVAAADIVLSPDQLGSLPLAIKEAMAVGALVVATPVGGVPELILDDVSGLLCADASAPAIAAALLRAIQLPAGERRRLVEQARRVARSEFHPQRGASDLLEMYNRTIDLTRGARSIPPVAPPRTGLPPPPGPHERFDQPAQPPACAVRLHRTLTYRLVPRGQDWCGVDVLIGTHHQSASGSCELTILSPAGHVVRTATVDLATARDNDWLRFDFAPIANATGYPFRLRFALPHPIPPTKLSLYDTQPGATRLARRALRRLGLPPTRDSLYCRIRYAR